MNITNMLVQYLKNPLGIETKSPLLSYTLESEDQNQFQTAYCILVSSTKELLHRNIGDMWDSGKVSYENNYAIAYGGALSFIKAGTVLEGEGMG